MPESGGDSGCDGGDVSESLGSPGEEVATSSSGTESEGSDSDSSASSDSGSETELSPGARNVRGEGAHPVVSPVPDFEFFEQQATQNMHGVGDVQVEVSQRFRERISLKDGCSSSQSKEEFGVDGLYLNAYKSSDVKKLREHYNIPESVTIRIPVTGECLSKSKNSGETLVHPYMLREGLRLPLHPWHQEFFAAYGIAIAQVNPNVIRYLDALFALYFCCGFGKPDLAVFCSNWVLKEHSRTENIGWFGIQSALKGKARCPAGTEMVTMSHGKDEVCCLKMEDIIREGMEESIEQHEIMNADISKNPLIFGNPTSQQSWKKSYFFVGGNWEFPVGAEVPEKRVPESFTILPVDQSWRKLTPEQESQVEWIKKRIPILYRRTNVLLSQYTLHFSGLAALPKRGSAFNNWRRYHRLGVSKNAVRERSDFMMVLKYAGDKVTISEKDWESVEGPRKRKKYRRSESLVCSVGKKRTVQEKVRENKKKLKAGVSGPNPVERASNSSASSLVSFAELTPKQASFVNVVSRAIRLPTPPILSSLQQCPLKDHCDRVTVLKDQMLYEEQQYDDRCYKEVKNLSQRVTHLDTCYESAVKEVNGLKAELSSVKSRSEKELTEERKKFKKSLDKAVAEEKAVLQKLFKEETDKVKAEAVLTYRRDPRRARESADLYVSGAVDYYKKVQQVFPDQDWSQLAEPVITEEFVAREHAAILEEIARESESADPGKDK